MNRRIAQFISLLLSFAAPSWAADLALVNPSKGNEERLAPAIVVSSQAEDQEQFAVEDLRHYLKQMTGLEVSVGETAPPGRVAIHVGKVKANRDLEAVVEEKKLGRDGFVLDVSDSGVRILGGSKFGTAYGVYELLERLGVRWLFPGTWGEVVPETGSPQLPEGRFTDKPAFPIRQMHAAWVDEVAGTWFRRSRHNRSGFYGHSHLISTKKYGAEHPEWYAEIDGARQVDDPHYKLCHSNEAMVEQAASDVLEGIREREADAKPRSHIGYKHLAQDYSIMSISPTDGGGFCRCAECLAMGSVSDRLQIFANRIAAKVRKEFPDYSVGYYGAYSEAQMPPTVKADPGVVVFSTTWTRNFFRPLETVANAAYREKIDAFSKVCPAMAIRDFDGLSVWWGFGPFTLADVHAADYQWYHRHHVKGIVTEAHTGWGPWGYSYYLMGKLWWNPYADLDALKRDFVRSGYGEAFEPMARYYRRLDEATVYPPAPVLHAMRQDLEEAARIARRPDVMQRIDALRAHYLVMDIVSKNRAKTVTPEEAALVRRVLSSLDRYTSPFTARALKKRSFPEDPADPPPAPWTPDELHAVLDKVELADPGEAFAAWPDHNDLRLVPWDGGDAEFSPGLKMSLRYGPTTLLIHARNGERLQVSQAWGRGETFNTSYQLKDPDQVVVEEGLATGPTILDRPAAGEGTYTLTFSTGGAYPLISVANRWAVVKASGASQRVHPMGKAQGLYFYVPKGTREFAFGSKAYEPLTIDVRGPDDVPLSIPKITQASQNFEEHRIEVPAGTDGKPWRVDFKGGKKEIFLMGVPPYLASEPSRLLVVPEAKESAP